MLTSNFDLRMIYISLISCVFPSTAINEIQLVGIPGQGATSPVHTGRKKEGTGEIKLVMGLNSRTLILLSRFPKPDTAVSPDYVALEA